MVAGGQGLEHVKLQELLSYGEASLMCAKPQIRSKIGLILNQADTFFHFRNILAELDPSQFDLILAGDEARLSQIADRLDYHYEHYGYLMQQGIQYAYTLSNYYIYYYDLKHQGQVMGKIYLPQILGVKSIRLMYTLGVDYWSYGDWDRIFDLHLTYGPWQSERLQGVAQAIEEVGYPRYDDFFNHRPEPAALRQRFGCDAQKPIIVWLPTRYQHTLRECAEAVSALSSEYEVLLKPHPLSWEEEPELIGWLQSLPFKALLGPDVDNLYLFALADFVFCDYGGTSFGALYTDQPLLLLNHPADKVFDPVQLHSPDAQKTTLAELNPTELLLRETLVNLDPHELARLPEILRDTALWQTQKTARQALRKRFFAPYYGSSAQRVAQILKTCLQQASI